MCPQLQPLPSMVPLLYTQLLEDVEQLRARAASRTGWKEDLRWDFSYCSGYARYTGVGLRDDYDPESQRSRSPTLNTFVLSSP